jgi:hypothetical protein
MTIAQLDSLFPYVCFLYGAIMTVALHSPALAKIAEQRFPEEMITQWRSHQGLALVCLFVGALWILQNL